MARTQGREENGGRVITAIPIEEWQPVTPIAEDYGIIPQTLYGKNLTRAERAELFVAGSAIRHAETFRNVIESVSPFEFVFVPAKIVLIVVQDLLKNRREVTMVSVLDLIQAGKQQFQFPNENPADFIIDAVEYAQAGVGIEYFAGLVKDLAAKRRLLAIASEFQNELDTREPAYAIANRFSREVGNIADTGATSKPIPLADSASRLSARIEAKKNGLPIRIGTPSEIDDLDRITGGFAPGQLVILAARPSVGKSALAGLIAGNVSANGGRVLFFSLEMSEQELTERMAAMNSGVSMSSIRGSKPLNEAEATSIYFTLQKQFQTLPFAFIDRRGVTSEEMAFNARAYARNHGELSLIVIDYLQLLRPENPRDPRHLQVGHAAKIIRNLAGELKCPILCLAQLNRELEQRGGEPRLSDLRDSGEIEQDADVVLMLHRKSANPDDKKQDIDIIVAKNRNGPTGRVEMTYERALTRFGPREVPM